jgi:hypothetical protein
MLQKDISKSGTQDHSKFRDNNKLLCRNKKIIDAVDVDTPPFERDSTGFWLDIPKPTLQLTLECGIHPAEAIHAAEHAFLNRFALSENLGTECKAAEKEYKSTGTARKRPARYVVHIGSLDELFSFFPCFLSR